MDDATDIQDATLLRQFIATRDHHAFAQLARRHVDLVYSAARRQLRDDAFAQDVTQQVFVLLAEKAAAIRDGEAIAGWLLVTTRYVALNSIRAEARRRRHEREAAVMHHERQSESSPAAAWDQIAPLLDDAVARLKREDRDALALRYFQGRSVADVAAALGISQAAAQKRLSRALEKLRERFARRGVTTSADALASVLMANALVVAPAALGTPVAGAALSTAAAAATGVTTGSAKGAVAIMAAAKTKLVAASVAGVMLVGVTGTIAYQQLRSPSGKARQVKVDPAATSQPQSAMRGRLTFDTFTPTTGGAWRTRFNEVYLLAPTETMKRVRPPFIGERLSFYQVSSSTEQVQAIPSGPDVMVIGQGPQQELMSQTMTFGGTEDVRGVLRDVVGVAPHETNLPRELLGRNLPGDWVVRRPVSVEQRMAAFTQMLSQELGRTYRSEVRQIEREAIVVRGTYAYHAPPGVDSELRGDTVHFYLGTPDKKPNGSGGSGGSFGAMFKHLEDLTRRAIIVETKLPGHGAGSYKDHSSLQPFYGEEVDAASVDLLLANLAKQTSFELRREKRVLPTWVFTPAQ